MTLSKKSLNFTSVLLILIATSIVYGFISSEYLIELHKHWTTADDLDIGYPLLAITVFLIYKNIPDFATKPALLPISIIALLSLLIAIAILLQIKSAFFILFFISYVVMIYAIMGKQLILRVAPQLFIASMALPFWYLAVTPLQTISVKAVSLLIELSDLTALIESNYITIPGGVIHVAGGCSGLKYFLTAITLALIYSSFYKKSLSFSTLSVALAICMAMLANWIRIFILVLVGYISEMDHPLMEDHDNLGWVVFATALLPWVFCVRRMEKSERLKRKAQPYTPQKGGSSDRHMPRKFLAGVILAYTALLTPALYLLSLTNKSTSLQVSSAPPKQLGSYSLSNKTARTWLPSFTSPSHSNHTLYKNNEEHIELSILTYDNNSEGELANSTNHIFNPYRWTLLYDKKASIDSASLDFRLALARSGSIYRVVYYWYDHGAYTANSITESKLSQLISDLHGQGHSKLVALSKICNARCQQNPEPGISLSQMILDLRNSLESSPGHGN